MLFNGDYCIELIFLHLTSAATYPDLVQVDYKIIVFPRKRIKMFIFCRLLSIENVYFTGITNTIERLLLLTRTYPLYIILLHEVGSLHGPLHVS